MNDHIPDAQEKQVLDAIRDIVTNPEAKGFIVYGVQDGQGRVQNASVIRHMDIGVIAICLAKVVGMLDQELTMKRAAASGPQPIPSFIQPVPPPGESGGASA